MTTYITSMKETGVSKALVVTSDCPATPRKQFKSLEQRICGVSEGLEKARAVSSPKKRASGFRVLTGEIRKFPPIPCALGDVSSEIAEGLPQSVKGLMKRFLQLREKFNEVEGEGAEAEEVAQATKGWLDQTEEEIYRSLHPLGSIWKEVDRNPHVFLAKAISNLEKFFSLDALSGPFVRDLRRLLESSEQNEELASFLSSLIQRVLGEGDFKQKISLLKGREIASHILFLHHHDPLFLTRLSDNFEENVRDIKEQTSELLEREHSVLRQEISLHEQTTVYERKDVELTLLPRLVAKVLLCHDGLNLGLIDFVIKRCLPPHDQRDDSDRHIVTVLQKICSDERLVKNLTTIDPDLERGAHNSNTVNAMLHRPKGTAMTAHDIRLVLFASCLTWFRQGSLGDCSIISQYLQLQDSNLNWLVDDMKELLRCNGELTRHVSGNPVRFLGLEWAEPLCARTLFFPEDASKLYQVESVKNACRVLHCETEEEFVRVTKKLDEDGVEIAGFSLRKVFDALREKFRLSAESLREAYWFLEAPSQSLLLRLWENAAGSIHFIPPSPSHTFLQDPYGRKFVQAILTSFISMARGHNFVTLAKRLNELNTLLDDDTESNTVALQHSMLSFFAPLRGFLIPQDEVGEGDLSWALHVATGQGFKSITSEEEFTKLLKQKYFDCVVSTYGFSREGTYAERILGKTSEKLLLEAFERSAAERELFPRTGYVIRDVFCYPMEGGLSTCFWDEKMTLSKGVALPAIEKKGRQSVKQLITLAKSIQTTHGSNPSLSLIGTSDGHRWRFLPNHPTMVQAIAGGSRWFAAKERVARQVRAISDLPENFLREIESIVKDYAQRKMETETCTEEEAMTLIETSIFEELGYAKICLSKFISKVSYLLPKLVVNDPSEDIPEDEKKTLQLLLLSLLTKGRIPYDDPFLYFGDSNWVQEVDDKRFALQFACWFNPLRRDWEEVQLVEGAPISQKTVSVLEKSFVSDLEIFDSTMPISRELKRSASLEQAQETTAHLLSLEKKFEKEWKVLQAEDPQDAETLQRCQKIRMDYQKLLVIWKQLFPEEALQYRLSFLQRKSAVLQALMQ